MGNSSSAPQTVTYQQMTPAQQHAVWQQYQASILRQDAELKRLQDRTQRELQNINNLRKTVSTQYTMMSPFNTSNDLSLMQQTPAYAPPSNQQPVQPTSATQPSSSGNPSICQSTANGGVCALTLQAPSGSGCRLIGQTDGNLVIYNTANAPVWSSGTFGQGVAPYKLSLTPNGNLTWTDSTGKVLWQTNTTGQGVAPYTTAIGANCNVQLSDSTGKSLWSANVSSN